jgi:hypothetical protein
MLDGEAHRCRVLLEAPYSLAEINAEIVNPLHCRIFSVAQNKEILETGLVVEGEDASMFEQRRKLVFRPSQAALLISPSLYGTAAWPMDENYTTICSVHMILKSEWVEIYSMFV